MFLLRKSQVPDELTSLISVLHGWMLKNCEIFSSFSSQKVLFSLHFFGRMLKHLIMNFALDLFEYSQKIFAYLDYCCQILKKNFQFFLLLLL